MEQKEYKYKYGKTCETCAYKNLKHICKRVCFEASAYYNEKRKIKP